MIQIGKVSQPDPAILTPSRKQAKTRLCLWLDPNVIARLKSAYLKQPTFDKSASFPAWVEEHLKNTSCVRRLNSTTVSLSTQMRTELFRPNDQWDGRPGSE